MWGRDRGGVVESELGGVSQDLQDLQNLFRLRRGDVGESFGMGNLPIKLSEEMVSVAKQDRARIRNKGLVFDFAKLDDLAFVEDGIEITYRDLLNEELSQATPLLRTYVRHLEEIK
jgi:hypothetical protein